jgi:peroxisomal enoyl-CoA hydratase 2
MTDEYQVPVSCDEVSVGDNGPESVLEDLERADFVRYAGASGDFNPIHFDYPYAQEAGNPDVFGQGMLIAGFVANMAAEWFGLSNVTRFRTRFQARMFPGDTVRVTGEVSSVSRGDAGTRVQADLLAENQDGKSLLSGDVTAVLPREE